MILVDVEQGTPEWWEARLGIPTASEFDKILTPAKLENSRSSEGYMYKLLGEWLRGKPDETFQSDWMKRGHEFEEEARTYYAFQFDCEPQKVGFCKADNELYGCSPDALIGDDGGLEIKCVSPGVQVGYLLRGVLPLDYKLQVIGSLLVTGRQWWDFLAYHPDIKPFYLRTDRRQVLKELDALEKALNAFCGKLIQTREQLKIKVAA